MSEAVQGGTLRPKHAAAYIGVSPAKLWVLLKSDPDFPQSFKVSPRVTCFYRAQLDNWLAKKAAQSRRAA